jgi:vacuolar-type H+-ATPase subunit D/Vma8
MIALFRVLDEMDKMDSRGINACEMSHIPLTMRQIQTLLFKLEEKQDWLL